MLPTLARLGHGVALRWRTLGAGRGCLAWAPVARYTASMGAAEAAPMARPGTRGRIVPQARAPIDSVAKFLNIIGRACSEHEALFPTWAALFEADSEKMKALGIPVKQRKWILKWTHKYT